jgi:two-component system cell cycle response regulator DivK
MRAVNRRVPPFPRVAMVKAEHQPGRATAMDTSSARCCVLLVDGAPDDREMYAEYLRRLGYSTLQADNAEDAYRIARDLSPSIVVAELRLRGHEDGVGLTNRLKNDERTKDVPVVMLTASPFDANRQAAERAGCACFLTKPCLPDALVQTVQRVLGSSDARHR